MLRRFGWLSLRSLGRYVHPRAPRRRARSTARVVAGAGVLSLAVTVLVACGEEGPTADDICNRLEDECGVDVVECRGELRGMSRRAEDEGCSEPLEAFFTCLDGAGCDGDASCADSRAEIEDCIGGPVPTES